MFFIHLFINECLLNPYYVPALLLFSTGNSTEKSMTLFKMGSWSVSLTLWSLYSSPIIFLVSLLAPPKLYIRTSFSSFHGWFLTTEISGHNVRSLERVPLIFLSKVNPIPSCHLCMILICFMIWHSLIYLLTHVCIYVSVCVSTPLAHDTCEQ